MVSGGKKVMNFDQLVRIFVDTDVDTHFIVSLPRTSTVADLRELVKVTHRHCYPDSGDIDVGKLAVPGGDYGYHLADFLLIGQVYDRYEGKVVAEVKSYDPASNRSQGVSRMPTLTFKTSSTPKKVPLLASQLFENVAGQISTNASGFVPLSDPRVSIGEPGALLPVGPNLCEQRIELIVPKLQKEEIDEDGNCCLGSQEPLDGFPSRIRRSALGSFERIVEEEDEKLVERPSTAVNDGRAETSGADLVPKLDQLNPDMCSADLHVKQDEINLGVTHALSSDIQPVSRKRNASVSHERPSKSRRLTGQTLRGNTSKSPVENGRLANRNGGIEDSKDESSNLGGTNNIVKTVNAAGSSPHMNRPGYLDSIYLSSGSKRRKKKALPICARTINENRSEDMKDVMLGIEDKEEVCNDEIRKKDRQGGSDLVFGSGVEGSGTSGLEVGTEEKSSSLPEDAGVPSTLGQNGKKKRKQKQEKMEKKEKKEKEKEKKEKKAKKQKQEEPEQEKEPDQAEPAQEKPELEKKPEQEEELERKKKEKKVKKEKMGKKEKKLKQEKEPEREEPEQEDETVKVEEPEKENLETEVKKAKKEKKQKKERKQKKKLIIYEITPLENVSSNPLLEESDKESEQKKGHSGLAAVSPDLSQHVDLDEKDSDGDVPVVKKSKGVKKKGSTAAAAVAYDIRRHMGDEDLGRPSASDFLKNEISESGTPQRESQVYRDTCGEGMIQNGAVAAGLVNIDDKVSPSRTDLFGDVKDVKTSPSYQDDVQASTRIQGDKVGSVESQETPSSSKHLPCIRAGRGAPSQTRSIESSRDVTMGKQIGRRGTMTNESLISMYSEKATQHSEGINLASEVSGAWLRRGMLESEPEHIDHSQVAKPGQVTHSRSSTGDSSAESDRRFADQTEVRSNQDVCRKEEQILEAFHTNHISGSMKSPEKHASRSAERTGGDVNTKNDYLEFFSQDQSFHVALTQIEKALSGSTTEDSTDKSDTDPVEGTDKLKQTAGDHNTTHKGGDDTKESSDESGDFITPGRRGFPYLTTKTPAPSVSRMTGNGGSQSFKRRASGVAADIEAKFAQFIESQGGLDEIMGITLGQRKCSMLVESSTQVGLGARSTGSLATPFGSPLDLTLNTQESVKNSSMAIDIAHASQNSTGNLFTPQFKVPNPVPIGTISGVVQGIFNSAATMAPLSGREVSKVRASKELRLKRKVSRTQVDKQKETSHLVAKRNNANPSPILDLSIETVLDNKDAADGKRKSAGNSNLLPPLEIFQGTFLDDLNAAEKSKSSVGKNSEKKERLKGKDQGSQFMIVNNTDYILEHGREDKKLGSEDETKGLSGFNEDGSLVSPKKSGKKSKEGKVKKDTVATGVLGSPDMFVLDTSGKKKRKNSEKEGTRKKKMKFLPEELVGKELHILPENSVERSARETEELYVKLEKANRNLWLQNNSVSSFMKEEKKIKNCDYPAADLEDTEGAEGEDVAQSRLVGRETELDDSGNDKLKMMDDAPVHGSGAADRHPSPELCSGNTEASDREDSVFQSEDEKAERQDKFKPTDVFDYVSDDESPTKILSKSAMKSETNEKRKAKRMEELSGRAVQRVLEDEMLHVAGINDVTSKKSRKDTKPVKWTVRMRGLSPNALATSRHGGTVLSDATEFCLNPNTISKPEGGVFGEGGAQVKRDVADTKSRRVTRTPTVRKPTQSGDEIIICPVGCGRAYTKRTSAYYRHRTLCTGAPLN